MQYQEEQFPLSAIERATVRRQSRVRVGVVLVVAAALSAVARWMVSRLMAIGGNTFFWVIFGLMLTVFGGTLLYLLIGFVRDFSTTHKLIVRGTLTRKDMTTRRTGTLRNRSVTHYYYFYFDQKKLAVDLDIYDRFQVGQIIEIERTTASHSLIDARLLA